MLIAILNASEDEPASEVKPNGNNHTENGAAPNAAADITEPADNKKRAHDGDAADQGDAKKSKTEEVGADA